MFAWGSPVAVPRARPYGPSGATTSKFLSGWCVRLGRTSLSFISFVWANSRFVPPSRSRSNHLAARYHVLQDAVYLRDDIGRQPHPSGLRVVLNLFGTRRPDDGATDVLLPKYPGQGELAHAESRIGRQRA